MSGGKGGGGGSAGTPPTLNIPPGLLQSLSSTQGLGQYGTGLFDSIAQMTNWASNIATGGNAGGGIGTFETTASQTGPTVTIGSGGPPGHDSWSTSFDPSTGQITFTNSQTGGTFQEWYGSQQAQEWLPAQTLQAWGQLYQNRGTSAGGTGTPGTSVESLYGPQLSTAWNQIQSIGGLENTTANWTSKANQEATRLLGEGQQLYKEATTGQGVFPSQAAWINQGVTAEQQQVSQQLAAEGLGSSTAAGILKGEAAQQGAATAGQLIQGNIAAAQNQINLGQTAQKLALAGQELSLGESTAMAQLALGFQGQMWTQAMQGYGALGQLMSTVGSLYGINIQGYSQIMNDQVAIDNIGAEYAKINEQYAQLAAGAASSMGQGLGALFGMGGGSGGGGLLGSGGLGGLFSGIGSLFGGGAAAGGGSALGAGAAGVGGALGGSSGALSGIIGAVGGLLAAF